MTYIQLPSQDAEKKAITIAEALNQGAGTVHLRGWIYRERGSAQRRFLVLRDGTGIIQCLVEKEKVSEAQWDGAQKALIESSVTLTGTLHKDDRAPTGYEVHVTDFNILQVAERYPITKDQSEELLLDLRHLWIRSQRLTSILKIRSTVLQAIDDFYRGKNYVEFSPPILTPNACEGGSTLFPVKYYDSTMYLTQSWQLYAEAAIFSLNKIYCISPCFRAEKSKTSRHLAEFWMSEMEAAFMELDECVQLAKDKVRFIVSRVLERCGDELATLGRDTRFLQRYATADFPTITYTEALKILKEKAGMDVEWGKDLRTIEEEKLMEHFDTPVVVTHYPKEIMAFYKKQAAEQGDAPGPVALCFDMLAPEGYGEIIGGSERDTDIETLQNYLRAEGEDPVTYDWYLDLRRYGSVSHSGFGLGVERVIAWICGLDNIKDAIGFPRTMKRMKP